MKMNTEDTTERRGRREVDQPQVGPVGARLAGASESKSTEKKMYEVEVIVFGSRSEIYHITAGSEQEAREEALWGSAHPVDENYNPQDHTREVHEARIMKEENV